LYLIAGWAGGCAVVLTGSNALGASGSLCGLLVSLAVWLRLQREHLPEQLTAAWSRNIATNVFLLILISFAPNVSWQGHLGGAIGGAVIALPLHYVRYGTLGQRIVAGAALVLIPLGFAAGVLAIQSRQRAPLISRHQFQQPIDHAEKLVLATYNRFVVPLLTPGQPPWQADADIVPKARAACAEATAALEPLLTSLEEADPKDDSVKSHEIAGYHRYYQAWRDFFQAMDKSLERPQAWPAWRGKLNRQCDHVFELRKSLEAAESMPRLPPLLPKDTAPGAPPPNTA
jgi:hypothetical protein